jgi:hypothetical protein
MISYGYQLTMNYFADLTKVLKNPADSLPVGGRLVS